MTKTFFFYAFLIPVFAALLFSGSLSAQINPDEYPAQTKQSVSISDFRISIGGGLSYLTARTIVSPIQATDQYFNDLKSGEHLDISAYYMMNQQSGLGIEYNGFSTKSNMTDYIELPNYITFYGTNSEKIYSNFIGASLIQYVKDSEKLNVYGKFSAGIIFYRNELIEIMSPVLFAGNSYAFKGETGITYDLSRHLAVAIGVSYLYSKLSKIKISEYNSSNDIELKGDSKENISRFNISAGIQYQF